VLEEHDQPSFGVRQVVCRVHLREQFTGEPDGGDVTVGVAGSESIAEAFPAAVVKVGPGAQQKSADPVERVTGAAPVAEGVLLHPSPDVTDDDRGEADGVEVVDH